MTDSTDRRPSAPARPATTPSRALAKRLLGRRGTVIARCLTRGLPLPRWGNLRRLTPFSERFGFERGRPIDRYYVEQFFQAERAAITGAVLEVQLPSYTERFGQAVHTRHTVDVNPDFSPTYCCDLAAADGVIPSDTYDCFLLPNTLYALRDVEGCLRQAYRVVRPGGTILATTSVFVPLTPDPPDYWHFTADGWREVTGRAWPEGEIEVSAHGNCLAAVAAMLGLAAEELTEGELEAHDRRYPVLVTIVCRKPARRGTRQASTDV